MRMRFAFVLALLLIVLSATPVSAGGRSLVATLWNDTGTKGGYVEITASRGQGEICFVASPWYNGFAATKIARGSAEGGPVVTFTGTEDVFDECAKVSDKRSINDILKNPTDYWFVAGDVHGMLNRDMK